MTHGEGTGDVARCACGAALPADAAWCPQCYAPVAGRGAEEVAGAGLVVGANGFLVAPPRPHVTGPPRGSRLRRSELTFGPIGRVVMSVLVLLPLVFLLDSLPYGAVGAVMWSFIVLPLCYRDIWRRAPRHKR